jgi:hypothetical protein
LPEEHRGEHPTVGALAPLEHDKGRVALRRKATDVGNVLEPGGHFQPAWKAKEGIGNHRRYAGEIGQAILTARRHEQECGAEAQAARGRP